jgi:hypothetical protein
MQIGLDKKRNGVRIPGEKFVSYSRVLHDADV